MDSIPGAFGVGTFTNAENAESSSESDDAAGAFPGLVVRGQVINLRPEFGDSATTLSLLANWDHSLVRLREIATVVEAESTPSTPLTQLRPMPPVNSRQLICAGANYTKHVREITYSWLKNDGSEGTDEQLRAKAEAFVQQRTEEGQPFVFAALPSALSGATDKIVLWGPGVQHDWELELAVVIGRRARNVSRSEAHDVIAGYTISNDISTRDVMYREGMPMTDFIATKSRPGFFPTGPYFVPREFVPDPSQLRLKLSINGQVMQDEYVSDIIYDPAWLVSYASEVAELYPGDLLLTGSPAGNAGWHNNRWLRPGDVIESSITGLGAQRNLCVAPPELGRSNASRKGVEL